jgi:hypothetical protein
MSFCYRTPCIVGSVPQHFVQSNQSQSWSLVLKRGHRVQQVCSVQGQVPESQPVQTMSSSTPVRVEAQQQVQYVRLADGSFQAIMQQMPIQASSATDTQQASSQATLQQQQGMAPGMAFAMQGQSGTQMQMMQAVPQPHTSTVSGSVIPQQSQGMPQQQMQYLQQQQQQLPSAAGMAMTQQLPGHMQQQNGGQPLPAAKPPLTALPQEVLPSAKSAANAVPANAQETLYIDDIPLDMSKRELSHIFRPFGGYKVRCRTQRALSNHSPLAVA